uniref:Uncharacterized protein n=1 Tax=Cacopsylla melanoneura TaxID=428564 RepID=A0A8D8TQ61_9HEMI
MLMACLLKGRYLKAVSRLPTLFLSFSQTLALNFFPPFSLVFPPSLYTFAHPRFTLFPTLSFSHIFRPSLLFTLFPTLSFFSLFSHPRFTLFPTLSSLRFLTLALHFFPPSSLVFPP